MKKENSMIQTLSFLSVQLEDSETELINAIAPGTFPDYDRPRKFNNPRRMMETDEPRYKPGVVKQVVKQTGRLAEYLSITPLQATIFVAGFAKTIERGDFDKDEIARFFNIKSMEFLMIRSNFEELLRRKIFLADKKNQFCERNDHIVNPKVMESFLNSEKIDMETLEDKELDRYQFVNSISDLIESRDRENVSSSKLFDHVVDMEEKNKNLDFVKKVLKINFPEETRTLFYQICNDFITTRSRESEIESALTGIYNKMRRRMCEKEDLKPILLFNEADALLSSRQNINNASGSGSVAQTENAIQNIILEEMEKLDGILIATTNLTDNLDSAFARRFLFKIEFGQPTVEAKQSIWKSKLEWLTDEDCLTLATKFDFSGGEIDNIVRKVVMEEVLHGARPSLAEIEELCKHEKIEDRTKDSIGFRA